MCFLSFADDVTVMEIIVFCQMRMKKKMVMIRRRSFWKREKEVVNLIGLIDFFLSGEFWQKLSGLFEAAQHLHAELLHCYEWMMFWRTSSTI